MNHDWSQHSTQRSRYNPTNARSIPIQFVSPPSDLYNTIDDNRVHQNYEDLESEYYEKLPDVVSKNHSSTVSFPGRNSRQMICGFQKSSSLSSPPLPPVVVNHSTLQRLYYPDGKSSNVSQSKGRKI